MSIEGQPGPIPTGVYNGFSAPVRRLRHGANSRAGKVLMAGVAAAGILGVGFGLFAKPDVPDDDGLRLKEGEIVQIEVGPGRAPVVPGGPVQAAPLQTLPAGAAAPTVIVARGPETRAQPLRREAVVDAPRIEPAGEVFVPPVDARSEPAEPLREPAFAAEDAGAEAEEIIIPPAEFADE